MRWITVNRSGRLSSGAAAVALALVQWVVASEPLQPRPNIVLILTDDQGLSRVGCYGGAPFKTPCIDKLAADGLRFERFYSMPICGPSRAAVLTGKYPFRTGATGNGNSVFDSTRHVPLPVVLQKAGYATCTIGKLGQVAAADDDKAPARLGFDEYMLWMGRGTPDRYWNPRYHKNGQVVQGKPEEYGPDLTHEFLVDFMRRCRDRQRPFLVFYSACLPHFPFHKTPDSRDGQNLVLDMVAYQDKLVGQLADDLEKLGLRRNTIIIFTTDNGPDGKPAGTIHGKPMVGGKGSTREGGVRQPLIVNGPGLVPKNRVCEDLGDFTDLYPTVLELAGVPRPEGLDGTSLAPQMLGRPGKPREWVYAQLGGGYFIADKQYKLYGDGTLVDITHSPVEERPVDESDAQAKAARERLSAAMKHLRGPDGDGSKPARATRKARSTTP